MDLTLSIVHFGKVVVASPVGELDLATAPGLHEQLLRLLSGRPSPPVVILLDQLSFCDAAGLRVLVHAHRRARLLDVELRFAAPTPAVARLLRLTGLDQSLSVHPAIADAVADLPTDLLPVPDVSRPSGRPPRAAPTVSPAAPIVRVG